MKKILSVFVALALCFVLAFSLCACGSSSDTQPTETQAETQAQDPLWESAIYTEDVTIGEGETSINVMVEAGDKAVMITVQTDAENLEDALKGAQLIEGEESEYGLYIKKVNGILADYDEDQTYWAIYKDGEYLMTGANETSISDGDSYALVRAK